VSQGELKDVSEVHLIDQWNGMDVVLKMDRNGHFWRFPVETVSLSESGFEKIFQGSCLFFYWPLELEPKGHFEVSIELGIYSL
jgi:alpha-amylase